jgi:hypothetical protein
MPSRKRLEKTAQKAWPESEVFSKTMERSQNKKEADRIHPDMTVLDVVSRFRQTQAVFEKYDERVGVCICCEALFEPLKDVSAKFGLDLKELLSDLESAVNGCES